MLKLVCGTLPAFAFEVHFSDTPSETEADKAGADGKWHTCAPISLTDTEQALLMMSAQGYTTEEIASRLFRTVDTMKYHRKKLFRKLGVESISEALATVMSSNVM